MDDIRYELGWDGKPLSGSVVAFDTETDLITGDEFGHLAEWPSLVLASASDGDRNVILYPQQLVGFIEIHRNREWALHNAAFDYWVVRKYLDTGPGSNHVLGWNELPGTGRMHDTMLLDQLVRIARGAPGPAAVFRRGLDKVALEYGGVVLSKDVRLPDSETPLNQRYEELRGREADWPTLPAAWFEYPALDAKGTYHAFLALWREARKLARESGVSSDVMARFGPLSERVQVMGACALVECGRVGFMTDRVKAQALDKELKEKADGYEAWLNEHGFLQKWKKDKVIRERGEVKRTEVGKVARVDHGRIRVELNRYREAHPHAFRHMRPADMQTPTGKLKTSLELWRELAPDMELVQKWGGLSEAGKLRSFLVAPLHVSDGVVRTKYIPLVRTGRTSAQEPNIQQIPRGANFRSLFMARPGCKLVVADYSAIELVTLGAVLEARYGSSVLADVLRLGRDPHAFTASMVLGMDYDAFLALKKDDPGKFKKNRQAAKAINFGVPGGLGARKLADYARRTYGVDMNVEEAKELKEALITRVYPELSRYLSDNVADRVAQVLRCQAPCLDRIKGLSRQIAPVLRGDKKPTSVLNAIIWSALEKASGNADHYDLQVIMARGRGLDDEQRKRFADRLTGERAVTLTGRVRGGVRYTEARNTPFQGLAADGAKIALWRLTEMGQRVVAFIHDEIVCEVPDGRANDWSKSIRDVMEVSMSEVLGTDIPVGVAVEVSDRWEKPK